MPNDLALPGIDAEPVAPAPADAESTPAEPVAQAPEVPEAPPEPTPEEIEAKRADRESKRKAKGIQRRFNELAEQRRLADERADRALALVERIAARDQQPVRQQPNQLVEPKLENFNTWDEYNRAVARYESALVYQQSRAAEQQQNQRLTKQQESEQRARVVDQVTHVVQSHLTSEMHKAAARYPDYAEVVGNSEVDMPLHVQAAIARSGASGDIAYYLAKNESLISKLAQASPFDLGVAMTKMASHFNGGSSTSNAPPPGRVAGSRGANAGGYRENFTAAEHLAWEARQPKR